MHVFCDVSKAFDRVWHIDLVLKLKQHGISGSLLDWLTDFLSNRSQRVIIRSCTSSKTQCMLEYPNAQSLGLCCSLFMLTILQSLFLV